MENPMGCCVLCNKTEEEAELVEMENNSLKCGDEIIEFCDLFATCFDLQLDTGLICQECQDQLIRFYYFKITAKSFLNQHESINRREIIRKLDLYLEDFDETEALLVLRYNQCFAVVPESKRALMENFQNWQPRVHLEKFVEHEEEEVKLEDTKVEEDFEMIVEEINEQDFLPPDEDFIIEEEEEEVVLESEVMPRRSFKPTDKERDWANETTKTCYSIVESEEGCVPTWTCCICGKLYKSAQALRLHLLAKHLREETTLSDEIRVWIRQQARERRVILESEDGQRSFEWSCGLCSFTCNSSKTFNAHLIDSHIDAVKQEGVEAENPSPDGHWKCLKCGDDFSSENLLRQHFTKHEMKTSKPRKPKEMKKMQWTCTECWFQFSAQRSFDAHMRLHTTLQSMNPFTELFSCEKCQMFFRSQEDLKSHSEKHSEGQSALMPAEGIALQKTILFKRLPIPYESHPGDSTCGHCGRKIDGEINCKSHLLIHHVNPLVCPKDGRKFDGMQPYICHLQKVHAELFPQSLLCTHCKSSFDNIYERLAHMKLCSAKKFCCDHCDKRFSNKNYLNSHLKREMGLLSCQCSVCEKIFKAKDELKIHMRTHTKEKPFKCSICEKRYTTTSARASHMETHKDTVIECEVCSVKFVARRHYIVHYKRYHDESYRQKKFQEQTCGICKKQFLRKDRLREHLQKAHC